MLDGVADFVHHRQVFPIHQDMPVHTAALDGMSAVVHKYLEIKTFCVYAGIVVTKILWSSALRVAASGFCLLVLS